MANVFAILSAIALAAALFLANKNKEAYTNEIKARQEEEAKRDKEIAHLEDLTGQFKSTEEQRKSTENTVTDLQGQETTAQKANNEQETKKDTKTKESDSNEKKIATIREGLGDANQIEDLVNQMKRATEEIASLKDQIASNNATLADLTSEKGRTEGVIAGLKKRNSDISNKISFFPASRISSIYPAFGFVTIPVGSTAGSVPGSTLNVVRDGAVIGKLRVRSVETSRSSADIVPDSLAENTTLMVGDRVVPTSETVASTTTDKKP